MRFRNPHAVGIASLLCSNAIAMTLRFLNCVDPQTHDLNIIWMVVVVCMYVSVVLTVLYVHTCEYIYLNKQPVDIQHGNVISFVYTKLSMNFFL